MRRCAALAARTGFGKASPRRTSSARVRRRRPAVGVIVQDLYSAGVVETAGAGKSAARGIAGLERRSQHLLDPRQERRPVHDGEAEEEQRDVLAGRGLAGVVGEDVHALEDLGDESAVVAVERPGA